VTAGSRRAYAETTNKVRICMFDSYFFNQVRFMCRRTRRLHRLVGHGPR
jgi:hypothetical protein